MTDREAIELLSSVDVWDYPEMEAANAAAIAALQERIDRERGCNLCNSGLVDDLVCYVPMDSGGSYDPDINFCPKCGRKMKTAMPGEEV